MVGLLRMAAVARLAAALVAVMLSGAPRVLAMHAPAETHRCTCRARAGGHHDCECAICRKAALTAQASDQAQPPCHRAAARKALASGASGGPRGDAPCLEGTCGNGTQPPVTIAGLEPFCLRVSGVAAVALPGETRPPFAPRLRDRSLDPETPPPRAA